MKFKITGYALKRVMKIAGSAVAKDGTRPILVAINCTIKNNKLMATGVDGWKMHQVTVDVEVLEEDGIDAFNIRPLKEIQADFMDYEVEVKNEKISYSTPDMKIEVGLVAGTFLKIEEIFPKTPTVFSISVDPKMLMATLKAYNGENYLRFDFFGEVNPFTLTTKDDDRALIMPIRTLK